jgi:hypothetical protein
MSEQMNQDDIDIGEYIKQNYNDPTQHLPIDCIIHILEYLYFNIHRYAFLLYPQPTQEEIKSKAYHKRRKINTSKLPPVTPSKEKQLHPLFIKILYGYFGWDARRQIRLLFPNIYVNGVKAYDSNGEVIQNVFEDSGDIVLLRQMIPMHNITSIFFTSFLLQRNRQMNDPMRTLTNLLIKGTNYLTLKSLSVPYHHQVDDDILTQVISKCVNLEYLNISGTKVTLEGLGTCLSCNENEIKTNLPYLRTLLVNYTEEQQVFDEKKLSDAMVIHSSLTCLELAGQNVTDNFVQYLLLLHPCLKSLNLNNCISLTENAFTSIEKNKVLKSLYFIGATLPHSVPQLMEIIKCKSITTLEISNFEGSMPLSVIIRANTISELIIWGDLVLSKSIEFKDDIVDEISSSLRHLSLPCNNKLSSPENLRGLVSQNLGIYHNLFALDLSRCSLVDDCIKLLFEDRRWTVLHSLNISLNGITDISIEYLCVMDTESEEPKTKCTPQLRELHIGQNISITDNGAELLSKHPTLTSLNVSGCTGIKTRGAQLLIANEPYLKLQDLSLDHMNLNDDLLVDRPITNTMLQRLSLSSNNITDKGAKTLFDMKNDKNMLMSISLVRNDLRDDAVRWLLRNSTLDCLKLQSNEVSDVMKSKLVTKCTFIQDLEI